ncbi:MAG: PAS domain S-box protein [Flavobacteriales bacterium]|nr:PAS domain S-box protein [Flavobacteriales bacterium]
MGSKKSKNKDFLKDEIQLDAFRAYMNNSPDFAFLSRIDNFKFAAVNDLACKEYGYTRKQFLALQVFDIEVVPQLEDEVATFYKTTPIGKVMTVKGVNKRKDGTQFPVEVRFSKVNETYMLAHVRDISAQISSQDRNEFLAQMTKNTRLAMLALDLDLNIIYWNKGCEKLFGYTEEEMMRDQSISLIPTNERGNANKFLKNLVEEEELKSLDTTRLHKSGKRVEVNSTYWTTKDELGVVNGISVLIRDISSDKLTQRIQDTVVNIAKASSRRIIDTKWFSNYVHKELSNIMDVDNFYIILYNKKTRSYSMPIIRGCKGLRTAFKPKKKGNMLFEYVLRSGNPLYEQKSELKVLVKKQNILMETAIPEVYLGLPLKSEGKVLGVLAVQSFKDSHAFSIRKMIALELVTRLISNILTRDLIINELMSSEEHYRSLSEKSADVISVLDKSWIIQYESLPSKHVFGRKPHEMLGKEFIEDIHPDDQKMIKTCLNKLAQVKNRTALESCRYKHGNGSWVWTEMSFKNLLKDEVVNGILVHKKNISRRYDAEEKLRLSEEKFKSVVTQSLEAIYFADPVTRKIIDANQSFLDYSGYSKRDLGTLKIEDIVDTTKEDIIYRVKQLLSGKKVENLERTWKKKSGGEIKVLVSVGLIEIEGNVTVVVSARDISSLKKTEAELLKTNHELDTFVYKASHDLRGPLTTCLGLVNMSRGDIEDKMAIWYFDMINDILGKLDGILQDLTKITAIRQGNVKYSKISLGSLINQSIKQFSSHKNIGDISINNKIQLKNKISSDAPILRMVVRNLIGNAIKYRKKKKKNARLIISATQSSKATTLIFTDNGIGVDESLGKKVFQMFFRGTTESQGSGLGLYMVRTGLDKINSSIILESVSGKGSKFTITLPILPK